jgi:large subunit ribosomal protein L20
MARIKSGTVTNRRHKKVLKAAKGYRGTKSKLYKVAKEAVMHAGAYAYSGRKQRKRQKKSLWIVQINAALKSYEISYSKFINGFKTVKIQLDRKILSEMAANDPQTFKKIVEKSIKQN